jgi:hypothetical protein
MKSQYRMLFAFSALLLAVSLACGGGTVSPTIATVPTKQPAPTNQPEPTNALPPTANASQPSSNNQLNTPPPSNTNSSDVITVEDQNQLFTFDIPGNWSYGAKDLGNTIYSDVYMFSDTWTSPDGSAMIESISGRSEGFNFDGSTSTGVALDLLNTYYSSTGREGDIRISTTSTAKDGSTRFEWTSKGGDYSGISWFEVRGARTFLMWTVNWGNGADQATVDMVDNAINTYQVQSK